MGCLLAAILVSAFLTWHTYQVIVVSSGLPPILPGFFGLIMVVLLGALCSQLVNRDKQYTSTPTPRIGPTLSCGHDQSRLQSCGHCKCKAHACGRCHECAGNVQSCKHCLCQVA